IDLEKNIDTVIFLLLEIKKKIKEELKETPCHDCNKLKDNCKSTFKKYNKSLSLIENIVKLQKEVDETNSEYFKLNKKYIVLKEKYESPDD
ncbi:13464_t:CDS:1, partial [Racocetra persica]